MTTYTCPRCPHTETWPKIGRLKVTEFQPHCPKCCVKMRPVR